MRGPHHSRWLLQRPCLPAWRYAQAYAARVCWAARGSADAAGSARLHQPPSLNSAPTQPPTHPQLTPPTQPPPQPSAACLPSLPAAASCRAPTRTPQQSRCCGTPLLRAPRSAPASSTTARCVCVVVVVVCGEGVGRRWVGGSGGGVGCAAGLEAPWVGWVVQRVQMGTAGRGGWYLALWMGTAPHAHPAAHPPTSPYPLRNPPAHQPRLSTNLNPPLAAGRHPLLEPPDSHPHQGRRRQCGEDCGGAGQSSSRSGSQPVNSQYTACCRSLLPGCLEYTLPHMTGTELMYNPWGCRWT